MVSKEYKATIITEALYKRLRETVENSQGRYVSISEVVREAVWNLLHKESK